MRIVDLRVLEDLLRRMPLMVEVHPLSLAYLSDDVSIFDEAWQMIAELDKPTPQPTKPMLTTRVELALSHRLPVVSCEYDPLTTELNRVLLKRYDFIKAHLLCQSQFANEIVRGVDTDAVALVLIDGLSYAEIKCYAKQWLCQVTPVLVDGASVTDQGMLRIVGKPPIALRLFDIGFRRAIGFTYWERAEEPLTNRLFRGFGDCVRKVKSFDEVLSALEEEDLQGTFVQIVRSGLDGVAHRHRERPNVDAMVKAVILDFKRLVSVFNKKGIKAQVNLVSDHGMLWAHEHSLRVYEYIGADRPRYYEHAKLSEHVLIVEFEGKEFALLEYPYLRRELRSDEWGVHGGLSFEESVVPWLSCRTEDKGWEKIGGSDQP